MSFHGYIADFLGGVEKICREIDTAAIDRFTEALFRAWKEERQVFLIGNGGSASTASHLACDLNKCTAMEGKRRMKVLSLVDNLPLISALTNDHGWDQVYLEQLKNFYRPGDFILGISVHGGKGKDKAGQWSQNLLKAMDHVRQNQGTVLGLAGHDGGAFRDVCHELIVVPYNTTPHIEAFHVVLHHLVTFALADRIKNS